MPRKKGPQVIGNNSCSTKSFPVKHGSAYYNQNVVFAPFSLHEFDKTSLFNEQPTETVRLLERLAEEFVHQVGNPLCALKGFISLAAEHNGELNNWRQLIHEELEHLENTLKVYAILAGRQYEVPSTCDLRNLVAEISNRFTPRAIEKGIWVTLPYPTQSLPVLINTDKMCLALIQLLNNALEASQAGDIIDISLGRSQQQAIITITNNVRHPISPDWPAELTPFSSNKTGHSGLGLWLTDRIISSYGGQLQIKSRDMLVTATISLPLS